jgi:hypothetical protein
VYWINVAVFYFPPRFSNLKNSQKIWFFTLSFLTHKLRIEMGCCASLFGSTTTGKQNFVELPKTPKSRTPPTVLDDKFRGKLISLNNAKMIATGTGMVLGKESLNTDKAYFEVTFTCSLREKKKQKKNKKTGAALGESSNVNVKENNTKATTGGEGDVVIATPFRLGVAVKAMVKSRKVLSGAGQPDTLREDDKTRWMWSWGPKEVAALEEEHVLGCAYDQSVGTGTIVLYYNGKPVAGPIPGGLRGIQGTCCPLIILTPPSDGRYKVTAITNFALNEDDFRHAPPEGYGGIIPAVNTL